MPRAPHSGMFLQHGAAEPSREESSSPARAPGVRQLADTFHLDARVHKKVASPLHEEPSVLRQFMSV